MRMRIKYITNLRDGVAYRSMTIFRDVTFKDGYAIFASGGHEYAIHTDRIICIEMIKED